MNLVEMFEKVLLQESASVQNVNDAINNKYRVIINYHTKGENIATGPRIIEVYAYGLTKAGNPVIRAFQPYGDTTSRVPSWKFFRLDRISYWKPTNQKFTEPASDYYPNLGMFNPNGDESMQIVYNIAKFGGTPSPNVGQMAHQPQQGKTATPTNKQQPQTTTPNTQDVYKTDTEKAMDRLRQQIDNPIYMSNPNDIRTLGQERPNVNNKQNQEPQPPTNKPLTNEPSNNNLYKTDTERSMDNLRNQLNNPRKVDQSVLDRYNREKNNRINNKNRRRI